MKLPLAATVPAAVLLLGLAGCGPTELEKQLEACDLQAVKTGMELDRVNSMQRFDNVLAEAVAKLDATCGPLFGRKDEMTADQLRKLLAIGEESSQKIRDALLRAE